MQHSCEIVEIKAFKYRWLNDRIADAAAPFMETSKRAMVFVTII
jgi:hypothetical protein